MFEDDHDEVSRNHRGDSSRDRRWRSLPFDRSIAPPLPLIVRVSSTGTESRRFPRYDAMPPDNFYHRARERLKKKKRSSFPKIILSALPPPRAGRIKIHRHPHRDVILVILRRTLSRTRERNEKCRSLGRGAPAPAASSTVPTATGNYIVVVATFDIADADGTIRDA